MNNSPNAEIPASREVVFEQIRRRADELSAYDLDEQLAVAVARRDVAGAHARGTSADMWNDLAIMLADIRETRAQVAREVDELTGPPPPVVRPLTDDELAHSHFTDDDDTAA